MVNIGPYAATDDEFHSPANPDDPEWTETCWFTFTVPDRRLSGQLYPFFKPTLGITAAGAYVWDETGDQVWNCRYAKNFWHLPLPDEPLSDIALANGARYRVIEPARRYAIAYDDPDGDDLHLDLNFTAIAKPHLLGDSHIDQPGRFTGTMHLHGERIEIDAFGFRDRSWGSRPQHGVGIHGTTSERGGYSYATKSAEDAFHAITMDFGDGVAHVIHGYLIADGQWSKLVNGRREVIERDPISKAPDRVRLFATDELGRTFDATSTALNRIGFVLNPNLWSWNSLARWEWADITAHGEDHDNWSVHGQSHFARERRRPVSRS